MEILEICFIAIGLAMDCLAVSVASSMAYGRYNWWKIVRMALFFGLFQGAMPLVGWLAGISFSEWITKFDHWFALIILCALGIKMAVESFKGDEVERSKTPFDSLKLLLAYSVATSIDALATGIIFVPYGWQITLAVIVIAVVSFLFSIAGCVIGISMGKRFKVNVELLGGIILMVIGIKIFVEHMFFS